MDRERREQAKTSHMQTCHQNNARSGRAFTVQAVILGFPWNYGLLNKEPSNNQRVGGGEIRLVYGNGAQRLRRRPQRHWKLSSDWRLSSVFTPFFFFLCDRLPLRERIVCCVFTNSECINTHEHRKGSVSFAGLKTCKWLVWYMERGENALQKSVFP